MTEIIEELYKIILSRRNDDPDKSYVAKLFKKGTKKMAQKVGEEGVEVAIAGVSEKKKALIEESTDLIFHLLVLMADRGVDPSDIEKEIRLRMGTSGLVEKKVRNKKL